MTIIVLTQSSALSVIDAKRELIRAGCRWIGFGMLAGQSVLVGKVQP